MQNITVTLIGVAVSAVRSSVTEAGHPMARFRMVCRPRKYDLTLGRHTEFEPSYVTVMSWRALAHNVGLSVAKGDPLVVTGRLRVREWDDAGRTRTTVEVDAVSIGHDLARGQTRFSRRQAVAPSASLTPADSPPAPESQPASAA